MREIGRQEIEDIAMGATVLGTGGGGDPYIGKLMALQAVEEFGPIQVISADELDDDALVVPCGMQGAPTVLIEKPPSGKEMFASFETIESFLGKKVSAVMPFEVGGVNSMLPLVLAASMRLPVVDADGMGRAFPEVQMEVFSLNGVSASPMVVSDEKGNTALFQAIDNVWAERLSRKATIQMGASAMIACYIMNGSEVKTSSLHHTLTFAEEIGRSIRIAKTNNEDAVKKVLEVTRGFELFRGKVIDINRKTDGGFAKGVATIEGVDPFTEETLTINFQNELLLAKSGGRVLCMTPDLISVLDMETGRPITTEGLRYGSRCVVIGIPCNEQWRTEKGIATAGPGYFGYDADYVPVENLIRGGE
ncbi:DUF917 domain-containing protein [Sporolactobacillus sp. THM7-7]|nr:DUF917 domain-containing protein [Sporolactobacillus sp. THM7-7]